MDIEPQRRQWHTEIEHLLSQVAYSIGLGAVWRFPYMMYRNGGVAFLVPYTIYTLLFGLPILFLEMAIGQFSKASPSKMFRRMCPVFTGLGLSMAFVDFVVSSVMIILNSWIVYYLIMSVAGMFTDGPLPWDSCQNRWNSADCRAAGEANCTQYKTYVADYDYGSSYYGCLSSATDPGEEYFENQVYRITSGLGTLGALQFDVFFCYVIYIVIVFVCLFKGVHSMGKVSFLAAVVPMVLMAVFFVRAITLPGALNGLKYYLAPDFTAWHFVPGSQIWREAATDVMFSLGLSIGVVSHMASHNTHSYSCLGHAWGVLILNYLAKLFTGAVVMMMLGFYAHANDLAIDQVMNTGFDLALITLPQVMGQTPASAFWCSAFFLMLFFMGLGSVLPAVHHVVAVVTDFFPRARKMEFAVVAAVCFALLLFGLPICFQWGPYLLTLEETGIHLFAPFVIGILQIVAILAFYGLREFFSDLHMMLGVSSVGKVFWFGTWLVFAPLTFLLLMVFSVLDAFNYGFSYNEYQFGTIAALCTVFVGLIPILIIVGGFILSLVLVKNPLRPSEEWKPDRAAEHTRYQHVNKT